MDPTDPSKKEKTEPGPEGAGETASPQDTPRVASRRSYVQKMAHELKTPITAIVAASEIMRDEQLGPIGDERYRRYAADIHDSARLMLSVIDRMMEQRSREAAQQPLEFTEIDPLELLHATVSSMLPLAERARIVMKLVEPEVRLPKVIADAVALKQMLINLMTNSLKFTPEGGAIVAKASYSTDMSLTFEICDSGRGMSEQQIADALEGLVAEGAAPDGGGLGVGLPLVRALAAANGARLDLTSSPGQGTAARIVFPKDRIVLS